MKPENLLYLTTAQESPLVLADFGIAKMLDSDTEVLTSMAGSFGYAAPEVMLKQGHGKAVDMWSMGVITYTLLCGYSPFRSESLNDLIEECRSGRIVFHERYWKDVSKDAKDFILTLLQPDPTLRSTSEQALQHRWLKGETATDHNILPELKTYIARNRLKRGIEIIKLANRIEALKMQDEGDDIPGTTLDEAEEKKAEDKPAADVKPSDGAAPANKGRLSRLARGAIFREVVLAKVREMKQQEQQQQVEKEALEKIEKDKRK